MIRLRHHPLRSAAAIAVLALCIAPARAHAQGTAADYARADALAKRYEGLATGLLNGPLLWTQQADLHYRVSAPGGNVFVRIDPTTGKKAPAFDHARIAQALSHDTVRYTAVTLPFTAYRVGADSIIRMTIGDHAWYCTLRDFRCNDDGPSPTPRPGGDDAAASLAPVLHGDEPDEGPPPSELAAMEEMRLLFQPRAQQVLDGPRASPNGQWVAQVRQFNLYVRPSSGADSTWVRLSFDGRESSPYSPVSLRWSPDSKKLVAWRVTPGDRRQVRYVISSPRDQLQPRDTARFYEKPGDVRDLREPVLFDVATRTAQRIEQSTFPNPYTITQPVWRDDSRAITFEYNERAHQRYRIIEVDANTGAARIVLEETSPTFLYYNGTNETLSSGKHWRYDLQDGREMLWMSERDGWNHLYRIDGRTGQVITQITKGPWVVRHVQRVDTIAKQLYFAGNGRNTGEDPYLLHHYRVNFDGTGLVDLTPAAGNHVITWSPDRTLYLDQYSQVNSAPVLELRRASDQSIVATLEKADIAALEKAGWRAPEVFVSKARDGVTDIWGVIYRPSNFDAKKRYPVIENIYAGPQGSFVPKSFGVQNGMRTLAELGFIVVQIDGMGTSNRSKAFHDVAFKDLADAGFADRLLWHKAVAAKYRQYDITRVGIYGTSAGGQNAMGGLLFHPEFYKVGFAAAGCHDNRMDKMWWNEQWMGWPIGPQYAASSNMEHAGKLQGKLLLVVGEYDTNVDPSSTMQVVNALIRANKMFDLLVIPNADHTSGGAYGDRKRNDFFVHHLMGVEPPDRNRSAAAPE